jgi:hypothetical protein
MWLNRSEQTVLQAMTQEVDDLPGTLFGCKRGTVKAIRCCYERLFELLPEAACTSCRESRRQSNASRGGLQANLRQKTVRSHPTART